MAGEPKEIDSQVTGAEGPEIDDIDAIWAELEAAEAAGTTEEDAPSTDRDETLDDAADAGDAEGERTPPVAVGPAAGTQPKPLEQMSREELLAERNALQQELQRVQHSDASQRGRISALTRQINEIRSQTAIRPSTGDDDLDAKLKQVEEEFPELAPVTSVVKEFRADRQERAKQDRQALYQSNETEVRKVHEDYDTFLEANADRVPEFLSKAPKAVRQAFFDNQANITDAGDAILFVTQFKQYVAAQSKPQGDKPAPKTGANPQRPQARRERQLVAAASTPPSRGSVSPNVSAPGGSVDSDWDYWERVDQAKARGTVRR